MRWYYLSVISGRVKYQMDRQVQLGTSVTAPQAEGFGNRGEVHLPSFHE